MAPKKPATTFDDEEALVRAIQLEIEKDESLVDAELGELIARLGGVLVWVDVEEANKPQAVASVLQDITGPIGQRLLGNIADCSRANCSGHGRCQPLHTSTCDCFAGFRGPHCALATTAPA